MATYDPKKILITLEGPGINIAVSGYADDTFVEIEPEGSSFERVTGADGTVAFVNKQMWCYNVTLTLLQTSHTNAQLTLLHNADKLSNNGQFTLTVQDQRGNSLFKASDCRIGDEPTVSWSRDVENREWVIITGQGLNAVGGTN
jgi:C4-type Zn-finger protein